VGKPVVPGDRIEAGLDRAVLSGVKAPSTLIKVRDRGRPWSADDLLLTMDFQAPEVESQIPRSRALCRELSEDYGLRNVFDLNMGIGSHVVLESALVTPGQLVAGCGRCLGVMGGVGGLALRLDEEALSEAIVSGRIALTVPATVRIEIAGRLPRHVGTFDLALAVSKSIGPQLAGRFVEFAGDTEDWSVDRRVALCGLMVEMGAVSALVPPNDAVGKFYKERGVQVEPEKEEPGDGDYEASVAIPADEISAVAAETYSGPPRKLSLDGGDSVQGVFVGGCYGGRYEDLALVSELLKRKQEVHPDVRLAVSPATLETARACLAAGFYETFLNVGAMVVVPGGGPGSAGGGAMFGEGERIASTAEYHRHLHPGQGVPEVFIMSAGAAAVAATEGKLIDPASYLS
jgi:homoaconitase/3-isopropylmalate dehydratase large subunit